MLLSLEGVETVGGLSGSRRASLAKTRALRDTPRLHRRLPLREGVERGSRSLVSVTDSALLHGEPKTQNPKPKTLNPKPQSLNPEP